MSVESAKNSVAITGSRDDVERTIRQLLADVLMIGAEQAERIQFDEPGGLSALGVTSIDAFELIVTVEERFGFEFEDQELNPEIVDPLSEFVSAVCRKIQAPPEAAS